MSAAEAEVVEPMAARWRSISGMELVRRDGEGGR